MVNDVWVKLIVENDIATEETFPCRINCMISNVYYLIKFVQEEAMSQFNKDVHTLRVYDANIPIPIDREIQYLRKTSLMDPLIMMAKYRHQPVVIEEVQQPSMANPTPKLIFNPTLPLEWCADTGKFHLDKSALPTNPVWNCPVCGLNFKNYNSWQPHVLKQHHCIVSTTLTEEKKRENKRIRNRKSNLARKQKKRSKAITWKC
jgi:uncharacterized C2H2 Zn-finger protein